MRLIITDLDGTLLDHDTYSAEAARPALTAADRAGVPVVVCSSKTRAELTQLVATLRLAPAPLIAENGSVVWFPPGWPVPADAHPAGDASSTVVLGLPSERLRPLLDALSRSVGLKLHPLSLMSVDEVVARTGLAPDVARLATQREFSEPFVCDQADVDLAAIDTAAQRLGARVTRGGRFFHLLGRTDKGAAVRVVRATCPPGHRALGLGDAPNDLALLRAVDDAVIVPQPTRGVHPDLAGALPHARHARAPGPAGWNASVLDWLAATAAA